ncbi:MAG: hypothetical protein KAV82_02795, partial [Phycisphaerae bacterium]|nr:hypothetical protein [Phycisphaerae bacterium]
DGERDELRMENGEWRMENGEWRMENGELRNRGNAGGMFNPHFSHRRERGDRRVFSRKKLPLN